MRSCCLIIFSRLSSGEPPVVIGGVVVIVVSLKNHSNYKRQAAARCRLASCDYHLTAVQLELEVHLEFMNQFSSKCCIAGV